MSFNYNRCISIRKKLFKNQNTSVYFLKHKVCIISKLSLFSQFSIKYSQITTDLNIFVFSSSRSSKWYLYIWHYIRQRRRRFKRCLIKCFTRLVLFIWFQFYGFSKFWTKNIFSNTFWSQNLGFFMQLKSLIYIYFEWTKYQE